MKIKEQAKKPRPYRSSNRAQAAEQTAKKILEAFLSRLLEQWFDDITLKAVAEDAGVTVQTVIRKFGNKEQLIPALKPLMEFGRKSHREWVEKVLSDYLDGIGNARETAIDSLIVVTDVYTCKLLRLLGDSVARDAENSNLVEELESIASVQHRQTETHYTASRI